MADLFFQTLNPSTGKIIEKFDFDKPEQIEKILIRSQKAFDAFQFTSLEKRSQLLKRLGNILEEKVTELATIISTEMGKPLPQAKGEVLKSANLCFYYSEHAQEFLQDQNVNLAPHRGVVSFRPLGVIFCIMPWNFPVWQVIRFAAPALLVGNSILLKHAPNVPQTALFIENLFKEVGVLPDTFINIRPSLEHVEMIFAHQAVQGISFTGSTPAGKRVAAMAGKYLKKSVLELGGSDPYLVFADADLQKTVESCLASRLLNSGQSCVAAKRFLVHRSIEDDFVFLFSELLKQKTLANALSNPDIGPLARNDLYQNLEQQVQASLQAGAKLNKPKDFTKQEEDGFYFNPIILTNLKEDMPVWQQETFGPVVAVKTFESEDEAITLANNTPYGLGAALFGNNTEHLITLAKERINAGSIAINDFVKSDARMPFGGIKESGYGRELSIFGLREFTNIKSIVVAE